MSPSIHETVLKCLERSTACRNDDIELYFDVIYDRGLGSFFGKFCSADTMRKVKQSDVQRYRAHIQNDLGLFLPTSSEVRENRKISEEKWRDYISQ